MTISEPFRRVVTGHSADGRAIVVADDQLTPELIPLGDANFSLVWTSNVLPADNNDDTDGRLRAAGFTLHGGSVIRVVDLFPGCVSPMHRTNSLDYGIILSGSLELELDDNRVTLLGAGDIVVQRGTIHAWRNPSSDTPCRIVFVLTEALPRVVNGAPIVEVQP